MEKETRREGRPREEGGRDERDARTSQDTGTFVGSQEGGLDQILPQSLCKEPALLTR